MTGKERILAKLRGEPTDSLPLMPITMMFAADLAGVHYGDYARDYRVLADAQVAVAERFDFDYVSAISDPAREASDLGAAVEWFDDQPPAIVESRALLGEKSKLAGLRLPDPAAPGRMRDRVEAVRLLAERTGATRIVEGWVEGPCAMGADLRGLNTLMLDFFDDPPFVEALFDFTVRMEVEFARAQVEAGATLIGVGDAAASLVGPKLYTEFVLPSRAAADRGHPRARRACAAAHLRQYQAHRGRHGADRRRHHRPGFSDAARPRAPRHAGDAGAARQYRPGARSCATARRSRWKRRWRSATGRRARLTSAAPAARCRAARRSANLEAMARFARSRRH